MGVRYYEERDADMRPFEYSEVFATFFIGGTTMSATRTIQGIKDSAKLYLAFELGQKGWKLFFTTGAGQEPRIRQVPAGHFASLGEEIDKAKKRFRLPPETPVSSCYEAGREGFFLHRWLVSVGVDNVIVDSASIEVNRRQRRAKSDRLDGIGLVRLLLRYEQGDRRVWKVVQVPSVQEEHRRHLHRHLNQLKAERLALSNAMLAQLHLVGILRVVVNADFAERLESLVCYDGTALPEDLRSRLQCDFERWRLVDRQIKDLENERKKRIRRDATPQVEQVRLLLMLKGVGPAGSWLLVQELFGWRKFANRKQVGALVGLTPTPYNSGTSAREQGISKAGNAQVRWLMVELAWSWVRHQPQSELTQWFRQRWDQNSRLRKIGIVAVARKLLIAFWRYVEQGEIPAGAETVSWREKLKGTGAQAA
jgi:transposase